MNLAVTSVAIALTFTGFAVNAQAPQAGTGAPAPNLPPATLASPAPVAAPASPIVRLPPANLTGTNPTNLPALNDLEWGGGIETTGPGAIAITTNRPTAPTGVGPRLAKPERRGFGGFLSGFANLLNPFAPAAQGTEVRNEFRYDGQINPAPQPRGLRDERTHEPQTDLLSIGFEGQNAKSKRSRKTSSSSSPTPASP